eukprot:1161195-Pelagomonas_calceolata.AAC.27
MAHHETLAAWVWGCWHQEMPCEQRYASTFKCCLLQWFLVFGPEGAYSLPQPASLHLITKCVDAADVQIWSALCSYRCRELHVPCPATSGCQQPRVPLSLPHHILVYLLILVYTFLCTLLTNSMQPYGIRDIAYPI